MMPYCQCCDERVVEDLKTQLMLKWDSYDREHLNHCQDIYLCDECKKKIYKLLRIEEEDS